MLCNYLFVNNNMPKEVFTRLTEIIMKDCLIKTHINTDSQYCYDLKRLLLIAEINNDFYWNHTKEIKISNDARICNNGEYMNSILDKYPIELKEFYIGEEYTLNYKK